MVITLSFRSRHLGYLTYLYERLPLATTAADLEALLPCRVKPLLKASYFEHL